MNRFNSRRMNRMNRCISGIVSGLERKLRQVQAKRDVVNEPFPDEASVAIACRSFEVVVLQQEKEGLPAARKRAIHLSWALRGEPASTDASYLFLSGSHRFLKPGFSILRTGQS